MPEPTVVALIKFAKVPGSVGISVVSGMSVDVKTEIKVGTKVDAVVV